MNPGIYSNTICIHPIPSHPIPNATPAPPHLSNKQTPFFKTKKFPRERASPLTNSHLPPPYHAILAKTPFGYFLTHHFLPSSINKSHAPNASGKKKNSTGTGLAPIARASPGMYRNTKITHSAKAMAGNSQRFCVSLLPMGGCWKIESRRVRVASRLNHCMMTRLTK